MKDLRITKNEENQRLDKFLLKYMNKAPKSFIYQMLRKKRIKYNGGKAQGNEMLQNGDSIRFYMAEETIRSFMEEKELTFAKRHFAILLEDDHIMVVSKPAGLLTHPENGADRDTLIDQVLYYLYEKGQYIPTLDSAFTPALCNRLDRNTSGIILVGKTLQGVQGLNEIIREKKMDKFYTTIVAGEIKEQGEITAFLSKDQSKNQVRIAEDEEGIVDGIKTVTKYKPLAYENGYTLLEVQLMTGKTHQIRAHMEYMGHCVVGDRKYGDTAVNQAMKLEYGLSNQFLHAGRIKFHHEQEKLVYMAGKTIEAPLSPIFQKVLEGIFPKWNEDEME